MTALTLLDEEQEVFRETVLAYAREQIGPLVADMDRAGAIDQKVMPGLFELGLMGIEVPERFGGAESDFFTAIPSLSSVIETDSL